MWNKFLLQIKYKCEDRGIGFVQVPRFYPSSKTCSCCGHIKHDLKLSDRIYVCEQCGLMIDRDLNAGINLENYPDDRTLLHPNLSSWRVTQNSSSSGKRGLNETRNKRKLIEIVVDYVG